MCDLCGKSMMSTYPQSKNFTVYCSSCWWSDGWDAMAYGREYDPSRPFLAQLKELNDAMPQVALVTNYPTLVNSEYVNATATAKNCYLIYVADECENVLYSEILLHNKDSMDGTMLRGSELCYWIISSGHCYKTFFSEDCENCQDVYFSKDLNGCSNCFGCVGLRNKSYHIFNQPYTREEYKEKIQSFGLDSDKGIAKLKERSLAFWQKYPHKFAHSLRNANVTGDYVYTSKNSRNMYVVHEDAEDSRYCQLLSMSGTRDSHDYTMWGNVAERIYECCVVGEGANNIKSSYQVWGNVRDIEYSIQAVSSSYLFGCANIRNKHFCILNKQYTEEEYRKLRTQIIQDMGGRPYVDTKGRAYRYGEFLPPDLSLFGYNETYANDFFPLSREEALAQGFSWYDAEPSQHTPTLLAKDIPDSINDIQDSLLKEIIECATCKKAFRIIPAELSLLRRFGFPIPRKCPNCRYKERMSRINPPFLYHRKCHCAGEKSENGIYTNTGTHPSHAKGEHCQNEFETSYAPDRPEIIYCEQCYQAEVA